MLWLQVRQLDPLAEGVRSDVVSVLVHTSTLLLLIRVLILSFTISTFVSTASGFLFPTLSSGLDDIIVALSAPNLTK